LFNDRPKEALPFLLKVINSPVAATDHVEWARRQVATVPFQDLVLCSPVLVWDMHRKAIQLRQIEENLKLLDMNRVDGKTNPADERARALVIAMDYDRLQAARKLYMSSQASAPFSPDDCFRLSQLCERLGDGEADRLMEDLL